LGFRKRRGGLTFIGEKGCPIAEKGVFKYGGGERVREKQELWQAIYGRREKIVEKSDPCVGMKARGLNLKESYTERRGKCMHRPGNGWGTLGGSLFEGRLSTLKKKKKRESLLFNRK